MTNYSKIYKSTHEAMVLKEILPRWEIKDVQEITEPKLIIDKNLKEIQL